MCPGLGDDHSDYPYLIDRLDSPISILKVMHLELVVSIHNVVFPGALCDAGSTELHCP